jgi:hypothetical protein
LKTIAIQQSLPKDDREQGTATSLEEMGESIETIHDRRLLGGQHLYLDDDSVPWILNHIDCFVSQSRLNKSITEVKLFPYSVDGQDDGVCDKLGQGVGNLHALEKIIILKKNQPFHDWELLALILRHVRQKITIHFSNFHRPSGDGSFTDHDYMYPWAAEEVQTFAQTIRGHPNITSFEDCGNASSLELYSTLTTLPALESISLGSLDVTQPHGSTLANHESLTELLRVPSLRSVCFRRFSFTPARCQATANALLEVTAITKLDFSECSFPAEESATLIAKSLERNTSVISIKVKAPRDEAIHNVLATALSSNSTLQELSFLSLTGPIDDDAVWSPIFLALGNNTALKSLQVNVSGIDESLCTAIKDGLGMNTTLESLTFKSVRLCSDSCALWCRALSFLSTNKVLKFLTVDVPSLSPESCISSFRRHIAAMLQENVSLERLSIPCVNEMKAEEYVALVTALRQNTTLKTLQLKHCYYPHRLTDDEVKRIASLLKKNYTFQSLSGFALEKHRAGDVGAILRLNEAGRRYLIADGSSISSGVKVLSAVSNDINCVFWHLLENPLLCERSAVTDTNDSADNMRRISMMESDSKTRHLKRARSLVDDGHNKRLDGGN